MKEINKRHVVLTISLLLKTHKIVIDFMWTFSFAPDQEDWEIKLQRYGSENEDFFMVRRETRIKVSRLVEVQNFCCLKLINWPVIFLQETLFFTSFFEVYGDTKFENQ